MNATGSRLAHFEEWASPRMATHRGAACPFLLSSSIISGASSEAELARLPLDHGLRNFWMTVSSADLFKDTSYGQWGLHILRPSEAVRETERQRSMRPRDFHETDLVIGTFYGDSDLLVMTAADVDGQGHPILVALPLDKRDNWYLAADSFDDFLDRYFREEGDKFWEVRN